MTAAATSEGIRKLILKEYRKPNPLFSVIKHLESAFREALAHENRLSVDNADSRDIHQAEEGEGPDRRGNIVGGTAYITTTNGTSTAYTGADTTIRFTGATANDIVVGGNTGRPPRAESDRDQYLAALDQAIQRATRANQDPMLAVVQALPNLEVIYPNEAERNAVIAAVREEVRFRLGDRMPAPEPLPEGHLITTRDELLAGETA